MLIGCTVGAVASAGIQPVTASTTHHKALTTLTIVIPGQFAGSSTPFYYGQSSGIMAKYGINLVISDPSSAATSSDVTYLQQGIYDIGVINPTNTLLLDTNDGDTVESFFGYIQANESAFSVPIASGITSAKQLAGKMVGISNTSNPAQFIAFLTHFGTYNPADIVSVSNAAQVALYLEGHLTAISGYVTQNPLYNADGVPSRALPLLADGINEMTQTIGATSQYIKTHKRLLKEFCEAFAASMRAMNANPKAASEAAQAGNPVQPNQVGELIQQIVIQKAYLQTKNDKGHPYGWMSRIDMAGQKVDDERFSNLSSSANLAATWTNEFFG